LSVEKGVVCAGPEKESSPEHRFVLLDIEERYGDAWSKLRISQSVLFLADTLIS
jgi:hypothetical protein